MPNIKFGVFTDLHYDHVFDAYDRLESAVESMIEKDVDFILNLGDFCNPVENNKKVLDLLNKVNKPCYHVIGNHDSDNYDKEEVLQFLNLEKSYYSVIYKNTKFIILDTCYIKEDNKFYEYNKRNHLTTKGSYPILPDEQLEWLKEEISDPSYKYVIASHHSFENNFKNRGVQNRHDVQKIVSEAKNNGCEIVMFLNGHDHGDSFNKIDSTFYLGVNAMSYIWLGNNVSIKPYSEELYNEYPILEDIILYEEGLYTIIKLYESGGFHIEGINSGYKTITPEDVGVSGYWNGRLISPLIKERFINI